MRKIFDIIREINGQGTDDLPRRAELAAHGADDRRPRLRHRDGRHRHGQAGRRAAPSDEDVREFYLGHAPGGDAPQVVPRRRSTTSAASGGCRDPSRTDVGHFPGGERVPARPGRGRARGRGSSPSVSKVSRPWTGCPSRWAPGSCFAHRRPQRRRQDLDPQLPQSGVYRPQSRLHPLPRGRQLVGTASPHASPRLGSGPHVPERRALRRASRWSTTSCWVASRHVRLRRSLAAAVWAGSGPPGGSPPPGRGGGDHRVPRDRALPPTPGGPAALRGAEAGRARAGPGHGAPPPPPRRAGGGHEPGGDPGHGPVHPRRPRGTRRADDPGRARHGPGHGSGRPGARPRLRPGGGVRDPRRDPMPTPNVIRAYLGQEASS